MVIKRDISNVQRNKLHWSIWDNHHSPTVQAKAEPLPQTGTVLGMCNGSDSRRRICAAMHIVGFIIEPRGRASRAGSCSGFRQVSHRTGTIKY